MLDGAWFSGNDPNGQMAIDKGVVKTAGEQSSLHK